MKASFGLASDRGIQKTRTGIDGLDEMTLGGLPQARTTLVAGGPGSGKTIIALQILVNGVKASGEPGIFVAFEENSNHLLQNAAALDWNLSEFSRDQIFFLDARLPPDTVRSGDFELSGLLASLQAKVERMQARRVVFDALDVLLSLLDDPYAERRELYRVHDWLAQNNLTGIITARLESEELFRLRRYDDLQYIADCVLLLRHRTVERVSHRDLQVLKYRGSAMIDNAYPMAIGPNGVEVFGWDEPDGSAPVSSERVSTGMPDLDRMVGGGLYRTSVTLVTGAPGTAKTTLGCAFAAAACRRGEKCLYVTFYESPAEIVRNQASVGIRLQPHIDAGLLRFHRAESNAYSPVDHLLQIKLLVERHNPACLIVDPLSAVARDQAESQALITTRWLIRLAKARGLSLLVTSQLEDAAEERETSLLKISGVTDNWIHLAYMIRGQERRRVLSVVKSRGSEHSQQVCEFALNEKGFHLRTEP